MNSLWLMDSSLAWLRPFQNYSGSEAFPTQASLSTLLSQGSDLHCDPKVLPVYSCSLFIFHGYFPQEVSCTSNALLMLLRGSVPLCFLLIAIDIL